MTTDFITQTSEKDEYLRKLYEKAQCLLLSISDSLPGLINFYQIGGDHHPKRFVILDSEQSTIMTKLASKKGVKEFLRLSTPQISLLYPRIRLYKSWMNKPGKKDTEFIFSSYFMGDNLALHGEDYKYLGNVGIKSFEFVNQGTDFATNYLFKCRLELFFGNIEELTAKHYDSDGEQASFLDLLLPPKYQSDEDHFRLKAVVGFSRPGGRVIEEKLGNGFEQILPEEINSEIDSWNYIIFLERITYNFDFLEDGTINLQIDFISSVDRTLESEESDIFATPEIKQYKEVVAGLEDTISNLKNKLETEILPGVMAGNPNFSPFVDLVYYNPETGQNERITSDVNLIQYAEMNEKQKRDYISETYGFDPEVASFAKPEDISTDLPAFHSINIFESLTNSLLQYQEQLDNKLDERYQKIINKVINNKTMYYFDINIVKFLGTFGLTFGDSIAESATDSKTFTKIVDKFTSMFRAGKVPLKSFSEEQINKINNNAQFDAEFNKYLEEDGTYEDLGFYGKTLKEEREKEILQDNLFDSSEPYNYRLNFVLLGNLLDSVLEILQENGAPMNHYAIALGDIVYTINGREYRINLADVPISREILLDWYNKEIFDARKDSYTIRQFLISMMRKIIPAAMNAGCWRGNRRFSEEIEIKAFTLPKSKYETLFKKPYSRHEFEQSLEGNQGRNFRSNMDYIDVIFIKSQNFIASGLNGNAEEDFEKGIYHIFLGSDRGIVKKVNFEKVDDANIIASNINKSIVKNNFGEETITTFYDANVEMIGNTFFVPGQIIYINPTFMGLGNPKNRYSLASNLGIGGYYDILQVTSKITPGEFTTKIRAKYKGKTGEQVVQSDLLTQGREKYNEALSKAESNRENIKNVAEEFNKNKAEDTEENNIEQRQIIGKVSYRR